AKEYHGVRLLLDAVGEYLPSPLDRPPVHGTLPKSNRKAQGSSPLQRRPDENDPFSGLAFKTISEQHGDFVFLRIYSGRLEPGMTILNSANGKTERISHIYRLMGARRHRLEVAGPGEIVAAVGLRQTSTGNTLCDKDQPILLEEIRFPEPVISQALLPAKNVDETKLADALSKMVRDDPTLRTRVDPETSQLILSGMGELHLEVAVHKLLRDHRVSVTVGKPMVAYRQTLAKTFELAAVECFREAQLRAGLILLEPIMNVVVHAPGQYLGDLTRDVSRRRGEILNSSLDKGRCQLHAYVPLGELFGYTSELRNFTSGTAAFTMEPSHYAPVKEELADLRAAS